MTLISNSYPIFEADQVLSQKHLNKLISYLEEQDRESRIQLLGMGLVCGLDITKPTTTSIHVSCGTGITSLGYLIPFNATHYTHFKAINLAENFLNPDTSKHPYLSDIYAYASKYNAFESSLELLTAEAVDDDKQPLTETILENKVVMLLVEALLIDEKNCVALDCNDKGKRLEFKIRPLLIDADKLTSSDFEFNKCDQSYFNPLVLPRYNVPNKANENTYDITLTKGSDITLAYQTVVDKSIPLINEAFNALHDHYAEAFHTLDNYLKLLNVAGRINTVYNQNKDGIYLQYVWDWMQDLVETYNEIAAFSKCNPSICCPDKSKFPFHILLGSAEFNTKDVLFNNAVFKFRTPLIKTGIIAEKEQALKVELQLLVEKLIQQIGTFKLNSQQIVSQDIAITPSCIGKVTLSKKAIPFYYSEVVELNKKWSPQLTIKNQNTNILSYASNAYSTDLSVIHPLEYDIQGHNFFRIEGHIGKEYTEALAKIKALQTQYRLPFKVIGVNAVDSQGKTILFNSESETWEDLEIEYDLAKTKLVNTTSFIVNWLNTNKSAVQEVYSLFNDAFFTSLENTVNEFNTLLTDNLNEFLENYEIFYDALEELNNLFLLHNDCIDLAQNNTNNTSSVLQEIENRLDDFNTIILEDAFTVIYEEAINRWTQGVQATFLSEFSKKHPALEHKAGVVRGGTFVLVYSDYSIFKSEASPVSSETLFFDFAREHAERFTLSETAITSIKRKNILSKRKISRFATSEKFEPVSVATKAHSALSMTSTAAIPSGADIASPRTTASTGFESVRELSRDESVERISLASSTFSPSLITAIGGSAILNFLANPNQVNTDTTIQKKIIADFYLPYICCSDGNNINIVLNATQSQPNVADFDNPDFNNNDFFTNE